MSSHKVVLLLGSNLGDTQKNIETAIVLIEERIGKLNKFTKIIETSPVEFVSKKIFRNIALELYTNFSPFFLLNQLKKIEKEMGRIQDTSVFGVYKDRIIDIDIVKYDEINFYSKRLEIPHKKHLYERDFSKKLLENIL